MLHGTVDPTIPPAGVWLARPLGLNAPSAVVRSEQLFALSQWPTRCARTPTSQGEERIRREVDRLG
jgi:hypothetical protein